MPPQLAWCQHFHYKLCLNVLDVRCKNSCPDFKTDAQNWRMQIICLCKPVHIKKNKIKIRLINSKICDGVSRSTFCMILLYTHTFRHVKHVNLLLKSMLIDCFAYY